MDSRIISSFVKDEIMTVPRYGWGGFYCIYEGENTQKHLENSRLNMISRINLAMIVKGEWEKRKWGRQSQRDLIVEPKNDDQWNQERSQESSQPKELGYIGKIRCVFGNKSQGLDRLRVVGSRWKMLRVLRTL